jgi:polar amino acid transport system substrate-binding protein
MPTSVASDIVADIAPSGTLRAAINFGNSVLAQKDAATGAPGGVSTALARELAQRLGVPIEFVTFDAAGKVTEALKRGAWDIAFLAIDPIRAAEIVFSPPYVLIEGIYVVPAQSPIRSNEEVDREGVRVATARGSAYDLFLSRALKHAERIQAPTGAEALDLFLKDGLEVASGVKQPMVAFAAAHPEVRMLPGRFMAIEQAMAAPKGRDKAAAYLRQFIEEMKASGFVARELAASGQADATVAPPV